MSDIHNDYCTICGDGYHEDLRAVKPCEKCKSMICGCCCGYKYETFCGYVYVCKDCYIDDIDDMEIEDICDKLCELMQENRRAQYMLHKIKEFIDTFRDDK